MERRNCVRYSLLLPILFKWKDYLGQPQQGTGFTRDVSQCGAFVLCSAPPVEGTECVMEILLPPLEKPGAPGLRLEAKGRIVRVELETGFAVTSQFTSPPAFDETDEGDSRTLSQ